MNEPPDVSFDGGNLDCGNGLLLLIRRHIDPMRPGQILEILSTETSVEEDLPSWCRLTGNSLVSQSRTGERRSFLVRKGEAGRALPREVPVATVQDAPAPRIAPLSVLGIGSWPRPGWMLRAVHDRLEGRLDEAAFEETARDAVRLAVEAQLRAGVDAVTDGEQRRDSYASFVGGLLENCQLIPLTDLLPYVDDPDAFSEELKALDIPAGEVRHPAVFGPIRRVRPLAVRELAWTRTLTQKPVKVALPGPYLLTRTLWLECVSEKAYSSREALAEDVVRILREELQDLLASGAALVQFDEPVLTEVVFSGGRATRSFMCGALSAKEAPDVELAFARDLLNRVVSGFPRDRTAMHVCRGNWSKDEGVALRGDYRPLLPLLNAVRVGTLFLELCTPRAGELEVLKGLREDCRVGVGVVNPKSDRIETPEEILARAEAAVRVFGADRVLLNPDCGFATFADKPLAASAVAEGKLRAIVEAARRLRGG